MLAVAWAVLSLLCGCARRNNNVAVPCDIPKNQRITIEFDHFDENSRMVWLRLYNRTAWDIRIPVEHSSRAAVLLAKTHKDGAEADVRYYLQQYDVRPSLQIITKSGENIPPDEPAHPPVPQINRLDFFTEWRILRNESVVFRVPKQLLARNVEIYVYLRYAWENLGTETLDGPVHLVYFRGIDLPSELQGQNQ